MLPDAHVTHVMARLCVSECVCARVEGCVRIVKRFGEWNLDRDASQCRYMHAITPHHTYREREARKGVHTYTHRTYSTQYLHTLYCDVCVCDADIDTHVMV